MGSIAYKRNNGSKKVKLRRFDDADFEIVVAGVNSGLTIEKAAKATGFARSVVYRYLANNQDKQDLLKRECKCNWLAHLEELAKNDWRAYAWMLERNFPKEFALFTVQRNEISGSLRMDSKVEMVTESELIEMNREAEEIAKQAPRFDLNGNGSHNGQE